MRSLTNALRPVVAAFFLMALTASPASADGAACDPDSDPNCARPCDSDTDSGCESSCDGNSRECASMCNSSGNETNGCRANSGPQLAPVLQLTRGPRECQPVSLTGGSGIARVNQCVYDFLTPVTSGLPPL